MNRKRLGLLVATAILVGVFAAAPAGAHTSRGVACSITSVKYLGSGHGGVPHYGVSILLTNNRLRRAWMQASVQAGSDDLLYSRVTVVGAMSSATTSITSTTSNVLLAHCHAL